MSDKSVLIGTFVLGAGIAVAAVYFLLLRAGKGAAKKSKGPVALNPNTKILCKLTEKENLTHDTRLFRFALPSPNQILGLPVGKHIMISTTINDSIVSRAYTPVSSDDEIGYFDLVIKVYFKNTHPKFPEGGKITQYLEALKIGDSIEVLGPKGVITYLGHGKLQVEDKLNKKNPPKFRQASTLGMIAGGSGITPMLQVIKHILKDPSDKTQVYLLFANQTEEDILCRAELEECAKDPRIHLWYTLDRPKEGWAYSSGFVSEEMLRNHFVPSFSQDTQFACKPNLEKIGFTAEHMLEF